MEEKSQLSLLIPASSSIPPIWAAATPRHPVFVLGLLSKLRLWCASTTLSRERISLEEAGGILPSEEAHKKNKQTFLYRNQRLWIQVEDFQLAEKIWMQFYQEKKRLFKLFFLSFLFFFYKKTSTFNGKALKAFNCLGKESSLTEFWVGIQKVPLKRSSKNCQTSFQDYVCGFPSNPFECSWVTMNIFRILGDVSHLLAMIILLVKIWRSKSCAGKSLIWGLPRAY